MNIILILLGAITLYSLLAILLKVPSFQTSKAFKQDTEKSGLLTDLIDKMTQKLAPHLKLTIVKQNKVEKLLAVASSSKSPEEFVARSYVVALLPLGLIFILVFINPLFCVLPFIISLYLYRREYNLLSEAGEKRQRNIETETLKFVMYMANALKTEKNIMNCIESYKMNFNTPLTEELTVTVAEMKIGNYEKALKNMEMRNNSSSISRLTRGLLSAMKGDEMTLYFENLGYELSNEWEQSLKRQALLKKPQINRLSYIMFAVSIVTVFAILATALTSSTMLFGGM
ncbi:type II secretion system F family protein [Tannockella kyphosi]|uniref:type II secretion system F family protein n=1 Tax=Tannockella kyphosi TaxID=2899121 RepID=UPI002011535B|nr:hypothetical protein [Tannockella kyphosi]